MTSPRTALKAGVAALALFAAAVPVLTANTASAVNTTANAVASTRLPELAQVSYRSMEIEGVNMAYREAGDPDRPTVLLLHGFPTSSHMFRNLIPVLATRYHVLAPDYPGFGASDMPDRAEFDYSFAQYADMVTELMDRKGVQSASLYLMDYGAPVGFRVFAENPDRVDGFIIQNGNAYEEGLEEFWDPIKALWSDPSAVNRDALRPILEVGATEWQYTHGVGELETVSWDSWHHDQHLLDRPGSKEIQLDLFYDYRTNVDEYPLWQSLFREHQPPAIILWGKNDHIFPEAGAHPYLNDLESVEFHLLDTGHFALDEYGPLMAREIVDFLDREVDN